MHSARLLHGYCLTPDGKRPIVCRVSYSSGEPLALTMSFRRTDEIEESTWVVARDLVQLGLFYPAGVGDMQIEPEENWARFTIIDPEVNGEAIVYLPLVDLETFIARTCAAVPFGSEHEYLDIDSGIEMLLNG